MGTPHNEAAQGAFAKTVLMPGDPLRAKFIAEHFLDGAKLVNNVRGVQGYTGTYRDTPVSVMASGMGMPSMGIYSYELFHTYDVDNIIRVGSVGSISPRLKLRDVVLGQAACTDSNYPRQYGLDGTFSPIADFTLLESAVSAARRLGVETAVGNLLSSDVFYRRTEDTLAWGRLGVLAVEMESAALYCNAAEAGKRALAVCTVSDNLLTGEALSTTERQTSFTQMITLALEVAVAMATDFNPGSCPCLNLQFVINLGCLKYKLTPEEVLTAVTLNGAAAIDMADQVGSVEAGKKGDLVIWDAPDLDYICYRVGSNLAKTVIKAGKVM